MMASFGKQAPWVTRRGQPSQNQMYSNYSQNNAPVTYPINYIQDHHGSNSAANIKSRSFTGVVTKMLDNHGFIDKDVYFHMSTCEKGYPVIGDRVMVEAMFQPNSQYKWTSTRVQVIDDRDKPYQSNSRPHGYNNVPPPEFDVMPHKRERSPLRNRDHFDRRNEEPDRKRRRVDKNRDLHDKEKFREREKEREREKMKEKDKLKEKDNEKVAISPRRRSRSSIRVRRPLRYIVKVPNELLTLSEYDATLLKKRFNFYIPSDFFISSSLWTEIFPYERPFTLDKPCSFHIMHKECEPVTENKAVYDSSDADYLYTAQVMLASFPSKEDVYKKCVTFTEDEDKSSDRTVHITRLIQFLVRSRRNEPAAIGGPWSPSLDGANPDKDPSVLIKTAVRTCKALTGVDLSACTQWYRFMEIYYHRSESVYKGKVIPARIETVVYFLPEVWTCAPTQLEWDNIVSNYGKVLEVKINPNQDVKEISEDSKTSTQSQNQTPQKDELETDDKDDELIVIDKCEPTHFSKLDPKIMKVNELRQELEARNLSPKGLKSQLMARLVKTLKTEEEKEQEEEMKQEMKQEDESEKTEDNSSILEEEASKEKDGTHEEEKSLPEEVKVMTEAERALWVKRYTLPDTPHVIVHPSKTAKVSKFDCSLISLHSLLDYHQDFNKEYVFEIRLFAEFFNDMLTRDFGYKIFKSLYNAPEKPKDEKDEKENKKEHEEKKDTKQNTKKDDKSPKETENEEKSKEGEAKETEVKENEIKEESYITVDEDKTLSTPEIKLESEEGELTKDEDKETNNVEKEGAEKSDKEIDKTNKEKEELKKKKPVKMYTKDKFLLFCFSFFDHSNCGYIFEKDLESLFQCLGLYYSRSQIKKIINKVSVRDTVHYRKLTDQPKDEDGNVQVTEEIEDAQNAVLVPITSNKKLLPLYLEAEIIDSPSKRATRKGKPDAGTKSISGGLVQFNGSIIDIEKLLNSIKRSESARLEMEHVIYSLKQDNELLKDNVKRTSDKSKTTSADLYTCREKLLSANKEVISLKGKLKTFVKVLTTVKEQIDPVIKDASEKSDSPEKNEKSKDKNATTDADSSDIDKAKKQNDNGVGDLSNEVTENTGDENAQSQVNSVV